MLASATANGTGVPQPLLDAKAAEVQKRAEAQHAIEVRIVSQLHCLLLAYFYDAFKTTAAVSCPF